MEKTNRISRRVLHLKSPQNKAKVATTMRSRRFPSIGKCIYCLQPKESNRLSEEHIIPYALNGTLIFDHAVCPECQVQTGKHEQTALDADLLVPRLLLELKRRRKNKKKPKLLPCVAVGNCVDDIEANYSLELAASEYPPLIQLIGYPPAGRLSGVDRDSETLKTRLLFFRFEKDDESKHFAGVTTRHKMVAGAVPMALAKIAYSYAMAELGEERFDGNDIRDLLFGRRNDVYNFIGTFPFEYNKNSEHLHELHIKAEGEWWTVMVHLFASCKMPPYQVVVGRKLNR